MRLFHFSDDPDIGCFIPRPVRVPSSRPTGREWLNGALVWAIEEAWQAMYLFPRDCPRILLKPTSTTNSADRDRWLGSCSPLAVAYMEWSWFSRLAEASLHRYELPAQGFESLDDAGMWISREAVTPLAVVTLTDLPAALREAGVELRVTQSLTPLRDVWSTTLHASGIRLRNAAGWT